MASARFLTPRFVSLSPFDLLIITARPVVIAVSRRHAE
jgi:hypothetical protein